MLCKIINDEQKLVGSGGGNPLDLLWLLLAAPLLLLIGCDLGLNEVVFEEEIPSSENYVEQLVPFGDVTSNLVEGRNDTVQVQVNSSSEANPGGLKILLDEFYKKYPDATRIKFTFSGITADTLRKFAVGLMDKESRDADKPGLPQYQQHTVVVDLTKMTSSEPYAWNNLATYAACVTLNPAELSIEFELTPQDIFIHNLMHIDEDEEEETGFSNITISEVAEHSVKFSLAGAERWSYLGWDAEQALPDKSWTLGADGGLSFTLNGSLPEDFLYRVVLENNAEETLVYYPEEHPGFAPGQLIPWEYFHEDYFAGDLGASAGFTPTGALRLNFNGEDSRVTVTDKSSLAKVNVYKSYTGENNGYLRLQVKSGKDNFKAQEFLSNLRFTLGCLDSAGEKVYVALSLGDYYPVAPDKLTQYAVYNENGYWDIKIPLSYAGMLSLRDEVLTVENISLSASKNISASYDLQALAFNDDAAAEGEYVLPLPRVDRTRPFVAAGLSMHSKLGVAEAELLDLTVKPGPGPAFPAPYWRKEGLAYRAEALSFVINTDGKGTKSPTSYTLQASGNIVTVYVNK
jgi:hypothetical protein